MKLADDTTLDTLFELLYDDEDVNGDVVLDFWLTQRLTLRCCGSHVPQWMPFPWAYCHCCGAYSMPDSFEVYVRGL